MNLTHSHPILKVLAYITHGTGADRQLLVFTHRDYPEAGIQVPAGTVKPGEPVEDAVRREVAEETGYDLFRGVTKLGVFQHHAESGEVHERHIFHIEAADELPETWEWIKTDGSSVSELEGYVFLFGWVNLEPPPELAGGQGDYLHLIAVA